MDYETVIGLEVHVELSTQSKMYCGCSTQFGGEENTHTCPMCISIPGQLPVLNKKVLELAVCAGIVTNGTINKYQLQDRKHYFYPDLPKSFQTTQLDHPVSKGGYVEIDVDGEKKKIAIHHIHFEEDAGKLIHDGAVTRVDLNRGGVPLIEIVTEPDLRSAKEACAFLETLRAMMLYAGVSDCKMQEGSLRCDVNVSVRPYGQKKYGVRAEMKNINSFSAVYSAIEYEHRRQVAIIEGGGTIKQETLRWDDTRGISYAMRSKEQADDYLYFPEPDIPMIELDDDYIEAVRAALPELPRQRVQRYVSEYGLSEYDAAQITLSKRLSDFFDECAKLGVAPKTMSNWIMSDIRRVLNERQIDADDFAVPAEHMFKLLELVDKDAINRTTAAKVFEIMVDENKDPVTIVAEKGMAQISDEGAILQMCKDAIAALPKAVDDYRAGNKEGAYIACRQGNEGEQRQG